MLSTQLCLFCSFCTADWFWDTSLAIWWGCTVAFRCVGRTDSKPRSNPLRPFWLAADHPRRESPRGAAGTVCLPLWRSSCSMWCYLSSPVLRCARSLDGLTSLQWSKSIGCVVISQLSNHGHRHAFICSVWPYQARESIHSLRVSINHAYYRVTPYEQSVVYCIWVSYMRWRKKKPRVVVRAPALCIRGWPSDLMRQQP